MSKRNTTRNRLPRSIEFAAEAVALVLALVIAAQVLGWHRPSAPVVSAPSGPSAEQLAFDAHQRAFEASLARLMAADACLSPEEWNRRQALIWARQYPARMIVQPVTAAGLPTWGLVVKPWSFSNVGGYVKGLCVR